MDIRNTQLLYVIELYNLLQAKLGIVLPLPARTEYPAWSLAPGKAEAVVTFTFSSLPDVTDAWSTIRAFVWFHADGSLNKIVTLTISLGAPLPSANARLIRYQLKRANASIIRGKHGKRRYVLNEQNVALLVT